MRLQIPRHAGQTFRISQGNHPGIKERLIDNGDLRRFINIYVNDEDVRFIGGLEAELKDGDQVVVLPAVAGG